MVDNKPLVLVVDGDDETRESYRGVLLAGAVSVRCVPSGLHAQQVIEADPSLVGLVLAEQELVGISGLGLLTMVAERWPRVRRVLLSQFPSGDLVMSAKVRAGARVLIRPVRADVLSRVVAEELHAYAAQEANPR